MANKEGDGAYVRSIVAKMDDGKKDPLSPTKSPPKRPPPSYLGVARTNSGYNNSLLYGVDHKIHMTLEKTAAIINGSGKAKTLNNGVNSPEKPKQENFVSLSMLGTKPKTKYSDLGLNLKSPEKNCRSFLRNINSFERIAKEGQITRTVSSVEEVVTAVSDDFRSVLNVSSDQTDTSAVARSTKISPNPSEPSKRLSCDSSVRTSNSVPQEMEDLVSAVTKILSSVQDRSIAHSLGKPEHDGSFFRKVAEVEKDRLSTLSEVVLLELQNNPQMPDEAKGRLRSASGKAKLLVKERFFQFDGLCEDNLHPKPGSKEVNPEDLAGFWDMVLIEVHSAYEQFRLIKDLKQNNWIPLPTENEPKSAAPKPKSSVGKKKSGQKSNTSSKNEALDKERKKRIEQLRKLRCQQGKVENDVEICLPTKEKS